MVTSIIFFLNFTSIYIQVGFNYLTDGGVLVPRT